ncbi:MAG TPA: hypothetical protein VK194_05875 [Candidatus Deferrimicrobium sp.]|nr:hypothetical protein [Candidatus Deferrimicrobium sp.]
MNQFNLNRRIDVGALVLGAIILFVGGYYVLRNTLGLDLGELDWEPIWPVLLVILGGSILLGVFTRPHGNEPRT